MTINELTSPAIGHNRPPPETLADLLFEETAARKRRIEELLACANERASVTTDEQAKQATVLIAMMKECWELCDAEREKRKEPALATWRSALDECRAIDGHYHALLDPLVGAEPRKKLGGAAGTLLARLDAWRRRQEEIVAAERQRLEDEARRARQEAMEAARREAEANEQALRARTHAEQEAARRQRMEAELAQRGAADEAAKLQAQADNIKAVIDTGLGIKAGGVVRYVVEIQDLTKAIVGARRLNEPAIRAEVQKIYDAAARTTKGHAILPGATIRRDSTTAIRRA